MNNADLIEQNELFRKDSADVSRLLDRAIGSTGARNAIRVEQLINGLVEARAALKSTDFARTRAEEALRLIRAYTGDSYIIACVQEGLGGVNG